MNDLIGGVFVCLVLFVYFALLSEFPILCLIESACALLSGNLLRAVTWGLVYAFFTYVNKK